MRQFAYIIIVLVGIVTALVLGKSLLTPLVFAIIMWFIIKSVRNGVKRIPLLKALPEMVQTLLSISIIFLLIVLFSQLLLHNIQSLAAEKDGYISNFNTLVSSSSTTVSDYTGLNITDEIQVVLKEFDFYAILQKILSSLSSIFSQLLLLLFYVLFFALEDRIFSKKFELMYPEKKRYDKMQLFLLKINDSISSYLLLKSAVSFGTAFVSYLIFRGFGLDGAIFWAFVIFLFNFIPNIGSIIATFFPVFFAIVQFGELSVGIYILIIIGGIQVFVGNVIEPKVMGNSLNISPLVVLFSLTFWGTLWGVSGMVLSVPITVIMIIVMAEFSSTRPLAILLSEKGTFLVEKSGKKEVENNH
ncbi:AI-2E family transporter [bacterium]|nr:AI-2E family transporter [bacterium]